MLALQHARVNREFYGRRYAQREMVWEELNADESEDLLVTMASAIIGLIWRQPGKKEQVSPWEDWKGK